MLSSYEEFTVAIDDWDWESFGHRIMIGSIVELQLSISVFKFWLKKYSAALDKETAHERQREWLIDLTKEPMLDLGRESDPVKRIIQPLRANLSYFEGVITGITRKASKVEEKVDRVNILLDCGVQVVVEALIGKNDPSPLGVSSVGDEIVGICGLLGSLSYSSSPFKVPVKMKVIDINSFERRRPEMALLTVEIAPQDAIPDTKVSYS